jgi:serine/threonine-protein kinase
MAEGGMGVVYRAIDDTLGRPVAIKMIRRSLLKQREAEEETVARFLREARAAAQIRTNHVAHVLQFGQTDAGDLYLVLEYLDGQTLTTEAATTISFTVTDGVVTVGGEPEGPVVVEPLSIEAANAVIHAVERPLPAPE